MSGMARAERRFMLLFVKLLFLLTEATIEHDAGYQDQKAKRDDWDR